MSDVVQKFWGFCHTLRHDGIDYGDYIEQITYLLFLKMADERGIDLSRIAVPQEDATAIDCSWPALASEQGAELTRPLQRRAAHARAGSRACSATSSPAPRRASTTRRTSSV